MGYSSKDTYEVSIKIRHNGKPTFAGSCKSGSLAAKSFLEAVAAGYFKG